MKKNICGRATYISGGKSRLTHESQSSATLTSFLFPAKLRIERVIIKAIKSLFLYIIKLLITVNKVMKSRELGELMVRLSGF